MAETTATELAAIDARFEETIAVLSTDFEQDKIRAARKYLPADKLEEFIGKTGFFRDRFYDQTMSGQDAAPQSIEDAVRQYRAGKLQAEPPVGIQAPAHIVAAATANPDDGTRQEKENAGQQTNDPFLKEDPAAEPDEETRRKKAEAELLAKDQLLAEQQEAESRKKAQSKWDMAYIQAELDKLVKAVEQTEGPYGPMTSTTLTNGHTVNFYHDLPGIGPFIGKTSDAASFDETDARFTILSAIRAGFCGPDENGVTYPLHIEGPEDKKELMWLEAKLLGVEVDFEPKQDSAIFRALELRQNKQDLTGAAHVPPRPNHPVNEELERLLAAKVDIFYEKEEVDRAEKLDVIRSKLSYMTPDDQETFLKERVPGYESHTGRAIHFFEDTTGLSMAAEMKKAFGEPHDNLENESVAVYLNEEILKNKAAGRELAAADLTIIQASLFDGRSNMTHEDQKTLMANLKEDGNIDLWLQRSDIDLDDARAKFVASIEKYYPGTQEIGAVIKNEIEAFTKEGNTDIAAKLAALHESLSPHHRIAPNWNDVLIQGAENLHKAPDIPAEWIDYARFAIVDLKKLKEDLAPALEIPAETKDWFDTEIGLRNNYGSKEEAKALGVMLKTFETAAVTPEAQLEITDALSKNFKEGAALFTKYTGVDAEKAAGTEPSENKTAAPAAAVALTIQPGIGKWLDAEIKQQEYSGNAGDADSLRAIKESFGSGVSGAVQKTFKAVYTNSAHPSPFTAALAYWEKETGLNLADQVSKLKPAPAEKKTVHVIAMT